MARRCSLTGKEVQTGNNVSHAHNTTRRRFLPNIQNKSFFSEALRRTIRMKISTSALRTVEFHGGLDAYLVKTAAVKLPAEAARLKRLVQKARREQGAEQTKQA